MFKDLIRRPSVLLDGPSTKAKDNVLECCAQVEIDDTNWVYIHTPFTVIKQQLNFTRSIKFNICMVPACNSLPCLLGQWPLLTRSYQYT